MAKTLYRRKLSLATNIYSIKNCLKTGNFPAVRSTPPVSTDESFKQKWMEQISKCKRELTLICVEEMNRKYSNIKLEIQSTLAKIETHLNQEQFKEIQDSLTTKFKSAAQNLLLKKKKTGNQNRSPLTNTDISSRPDQRPQNTKIDSTKCC